MALLSWYVIVETKPGPLPWSWVIPSNVH
jgi:hypothetical protein